MSEIGSEERRRRRLTPETMTPEQRAAYDIRKAERDSPEYREGLRRDVEAYREEHPPAVIAPDLAEAIGLLRSAREAQGLSLGEMQKRTGLDKSTLSKLETGNIANPTIRTIRIYAKALGKDVVWRLVDATN